MKTMMNKKYRSQADIAGCRKWWAVVTVVLLWAISPTLGWAQTPTDAPKAADMKKEAVPQVDQRIQLEKAKAAAAAAAAAAKAKKPAKPRNGWHPKLSLGVNVLLNHSANIPGVDDGFTFSLGVVLTGELLFLHNQHEWKSTLKGVHTQTKTPSIEPFVKTADNLDLQTFYTYRLKGKAQIGVFGGLQLNVALFPGFLVTAKDTKLAVVDGQTRTGKVALKNIPFPLTPAFAPLIFKQKLGLESKPFEDSFAKLEIKLNVAAQEVFATGVVLQDDAATPELELIPLRDYVQFGAELGIKLSGDINKRVSYSFEAELMYPFVTSIPTTLQGFDLLNADIAMKVSVKLFKWASLDYVFGAKYIPLLLRKWQVTNNLVLSLKADIL